MTTEQQRRERVRNGSRRQRDLAAVRPSFDYDAYAAKHFPDQEHYALSAAIFTVRKRHGERQYPDPVEVRERLAEKDWLR